MSSLIPKNGMSERKTGKSVVTHGNRSAPKNRSTLKYVITFAVAAAADALQVAFPPFWIPLSIVTALILFALWGWRWEILAVLVPELAPIVDVFPSWVAIALYLTGRDSAFGGGIEAPDFKTEDFKTDDRREKEEGSTARRGGG